MSAAITRAVVTNAAATPTAPSAARTCSTVPEATVPMTRALAAWTLTNAPLARPPAVQTRSVGIKRAATCAAVPQDSSSPPTVAVRTWTSVRSQGTPSVRPTRGVSTPLDRIPASVTTDSGSIHPRRRHATMWTSARSSLGSVTSGASTSLARTGAPATRATNCQRTTGPAMI